MEEKAKQSRIAKMCSHVVILAGSSRGAQALSLVGSVAASIA